VEKKTPCFHWKRRRRKGKVCGKEGGKKTRKKKERKERQFLKKVTYDWERSWPIGILGLGSND